ncbi:MAG: hypothetical protein AAGD96_10170 [Chloroflexota bacterium]
MSETTVHIINHTHWDREWFLTSIYTTEWIPGLINRLEEMVAENPDFHYLLDGQTLIVEDLLSIRPEYEGKVRKLVSAGNLLIGPYYCQPDWQLTCGESLMRNLQYGLEIMSHFGGQTNVGWMVDTFGHVSQSPQIHRKHGIDTVYVWRGMPQLEPYFEWHSRSGHKLFGIDLFGGYRNLYGVTHAPDVAEVRLSQEAERLMPYYPTPDVPLFDGYDLEDNPEDPVRWLQNRNQIPSHINITEATPISFAQTMRPKLNGSLPQLTGELNSGKYGATFPGTFSNRAYLKLMGHDCEHLLYQVVEPLSAMAALKGGNWEAEKFKAWTKIILQNAVHDAICGVSIDQVHEKMEFSYRKIFEEMTAEIDEKLPLVLNGFASGKYAVSTSAVPFQKWMRVGDELLHIKSDGMGAQPVADSENINSSEQELADFSWNNGHHQAQVSAEGVLTVDGSTFGPIQISAEAGDTYSDETKDVLGILKPSGQLKMEAESNGYAVVSFDGRFDLPDGDVSATVRYTFDLSPLVGVEVELDSRGVNFHAEMLFDSNIQGSIMAGMPFDRVTRPVSDTDLLPRNLDDSLSKIMMGQRELNVMNTFPMHGFVGMVDSEKSALVFSKGIRSYRSWNDGKLGISLRRTVEWVTEGNLTNRIGDAGPFFYVPDARCERKITHNLAVYAGDIRPDDARFNNLEASFMHDPLIVNVQDDGDASSWGALQSDQPVTAVWPTEDGLSGRVWHATGEQAGLIEEKALSKNKSSQKGGLHSARIDLLNRPMVRMGDNKGLPNENVLGQLQQKVEQLEGKAADARKRLAAASGTEKLKVEHELYVYERERYEFLLSIRLNQLKIAQNGELSESYLYQPDPEVTEIGYRLNQLRIKRRIFDYVVTVI